MAAQKWCTGFAGFMTCHHHFLVSYEPCTSVKNKAKKPCDQNPWFILILFRNGILKNKKKEGPHPLFIAYPSVPQKKGKYSAFLGSEMQIWANP